MEIKRFFGSKIDNKIFLTDREYIHCVKVTRHKTGYSLICCTGDGNDYLCKITEILKDSVVCDIEKVERNISEISRPLILCQALCKEFDFVVQKAVELGVTKIVPYVSSRTNVKKFSKERTESIILDAAKQCGRAIITDVHDLLTFEEAISSFDNSFNKLFCYELERDTTIKSVIKDKTLPTVLFIGSEGGFAEDELHLAKENGFNAVTLGKRILRVETASISALTLTLDAIGDIC